MKRKLDEIQDGDSGTAEEENDAAPEPTKSRKKSKLADRDFNNQEISKLKETEALFHSSLFRLQVSELLKEVSMKQKMKSRLDEAISFLTKKLKSLPDGKEHKITDKKWLRSKGIKIPLIEKPAQVKGNFQFLPPVSVEIVGSFHLETVIMPDIQADLLLVIPKSFFQSKDYLNQRYTRKRALYLCAIATHLSKLERVQDVNFSYMQGNPHKPVLIVRVEGQDKKKVTLTLQAVPEVDTFKESRFHVSKNNIRPSWFNNKQGANEDDDVGADALPSTPFYNSTVLHDICTWRNEKFVEKILSGSEGVREGIKLLKVWLRQRELLKGQGSFSSFLMSCYVAYLIITRKVNKMMNYYQVFRTAVLYLSKADWVLEPPTLFEDTVLKTQPTIDEFRESGYCVFVDRTGFYNLAFMLPPHTFLRVKHEAQLSIAALDQHQQSSFDALFMTQVSFARKFDHIFHLVLKGDLMKKSLEKIEGLQTQVMDAGGQLCLPLVGHVVKVLTEALGKRSLLIQPQILQVKEWSKGDDPHDFNSESHLTFGICIDTANAFSILDKGPSAEAVESREFRAYWGEKSEMRRFKDGTIHEAVLWTESTCQSDRRLVCKKIVQHVLERHCAIPSKYVQNMEGHLDPLLHLNLVPKDADQVYGTGEEQSLAVHHAFDHVSRAVRTVSALPLSIHSIQGTHPVFRHASVFPPLPILSATNDDEVMKGHVVPIEGKPLPRHIPALKVICMLEGSGKWPEEADAIKCLKTLLHVKMGNELKEKHSIPISIHEDHVDIIMEGFAFRLVIANTRELAVLRTVKTESGMVKFKDTEKCLALEREIVDLPKITHLLHSVQQENPVFSATVRLCKRWLAAQMAWDLMQEEAVELLVAYLFTSSHPYTVPGSPNTGLLRFLHLLSSFNWKAEPLLVNLNKDFIEEDFSSIPKEFQKNRASLPSMCICTPSDKQGTKWTKPLPTDLFLKRLILLARESMLALEIQIMRKSVVDDFKMIFRPPLAHFDLLIYMLRKVNNLHFQGVDEKKDVVVSAPKSKHTVSSKVFPVVDFCVTDKFYQDLQNSFGDFAMFFFDPFGGNVIGLVWKPQAFNNKMFKSANLRYCMPAVDYKETPCLQTLKDLILDDIRVMGGGIVESIVSPKDVA